MTYVEISNMVKSIGLPYAYNEFPEGTQQAPPFICFLYDSSDDFAADNVNYAKVRHLVIELYTDNKDFSLEQTVETTLATNGLFYTRNETYLTSEQMFLVTYEMEVCING